jgi:predicted metalloprotease
MVRKWRARHAARSSRVAVALLTLALAATLLAPATAGAWQESVPPAQGYRGDEQAEPYRGVFADLAIAIDAFWEGTFRAARVAYISPSVVPIEQMLVTGCGQQGPESAAFYCRPDMTIYLSPYFLSDVELAVGDYAPITILAHEWGHHVQFLTDTPNPPGNTFELQADCLAGVYTADAELNGLLDPGDIAEAVTISRDAGDPLGLPQDRPGSHGINDDRIKAFMRGYLNGLAACSMPQLSASSAPRVPTMPTSRTPQPVANPALPSDLPLAHAPCFRIESDELLSFEQLVARLGGTDEARSRLQDWGWQGSARRTFACDNPPFGEAGWIDVSLHRFAAAGAARQAVDYFAAVRAEGTSLAFEAPPPVGDYAVALTGPASNGTEYTLYASGGPVLVRVTGVSPSGKPVANVETVAQATLSPAPLPPPGYSAVASYLPATLPLDHAGCFRILADQTLTFDELASRFTDSADVAAWLRVWGWQSGVYREFACDAPPPGEAGWIDISIHRFADSGSAQRALTYFADARAADTGLLRGAAPALGDASAVVTGPIANGNDFTLYASSGPMLVRVTGVSHSGIPFINVLAITQAILSGIAT